MKRLILRLVCFFLALLAVPLGYFAWVQSLPAMSRGSLMGSILIKQQLAENTPGARILVVGGSSVPYSIQCEVIQQQTGMPCIAMGATAYLGLEYYLSLLEDHLHQGDLVILAPEIVMLQDQVSYSTTWMAVENDPGLLAAVPLSYWPGMVSGYYTYSRQKLDLYRQKGAPTQSPQEQYEAFGFGPWGDIPGQRESLLESLPVTGATAVMYLLLALLCWGMSRAFGLRGDMAFIGPRPERKFYIDQILEHDPRYTYLYQIRPGVTSYATLYNGYTDTMEKMLRRLEYDLYYLGHRSWWFDFKILLNTFCSIVFGKKF